MSKFEHDLFDEDGNRKYLIGEERQRFFDHIEPALSKPGDREKKTFPLLLYYTGCRISEGLAVTYNDIDYSTGGVIFRTLKRRKTTHRFVPLPHSFMVRLDDVNHVKEQQNARTLGPARERIWPMGRTTAWRLISRVMEDAGIEGVQATPKGLRHSFVIEHQSLGTPAHMIQKWAGWSSAKMMQVYGRAIGSEEQELASRLWQR